MNKIVSFTPASNNYNPVYEYLSNFSTRYAKGVSLGYGKKYDFT